MNTLTIATKDIARSDFDVVVVGGGTGGVIAAIAAARAGAKTALVEASGYVGGNAVDGGTALHSFYNNYTAFDRPKTQLVKGIAQELIDQLVAQGACFGHVQMNEDNSYDSVCTNIDVEQYKYIAQTFLDQEGVTLYMETRMVDVVAQAGVVQAVVISHHGGMEALCAKAFVDCTGYGDLCAFAGASYEENNSYACANSIGVGGVDVNKYVQYFTEQSAIRECGYGNKPDGTRQVVRVEAIGQALSQAFADKMNAIGMQTVITCMRNDYFMFLKVNYRLDRSAVDVHALSAGGLELRKRQQMAVALLREYIPGCENAFVARSAPHVTIRRARIIHCDKDLTDEEVTSGTHFDDDIGVYGFHDEAPRRNINKGGSYGFPYRMLLPKNLENVYATGMMLTSNIHAHMSTRNTVACMVQGQAAGVAAALIAKKNIASRQLSYSMLRETLEKQQVCFEKMK